MYPYLFLGSHRFFSYEVIASLGVIAAFAYLSLTFLRMNIKAWQIALFVFLGTWVQFYGGAILPFLYMGYHDHRGPWWNLWKESPGRFFHSTAVSLIVFAVVYSKCFKWPVRKVLDRLSIALVMGSSIARLGCFCHGCCGGKPCDLPWAVAFPAHPGIRVHPAQLYMFALETMLWVFLMFWNRREKRDGRTFWAAVALYSIYRMGIEFLRTNPIFILGLTHAQVFSLFTLALALFKMLRPDQKQVS